MVRNRRGALIAIPFILLIVLGISLLVISLLNAYFKLKITRPNLEVGGNSYYADNIPLNFLMDQSCSFSFHLPYANNGEMIEKLDIDNLKRCWIYFFDEKVNSKVNDMIDKAAVISASLSIDDLRITYKLGDYVSKDGNIKHYSYGLVASKKDIISRNYVLDYKGKNLIIGVRYFVSKK